MLGKHLVELALLEQLGHGADREAQRGHGGAQAEGLLHGPGGPQLVVAQADAEAALVAATTIPLAALTGAALAGASAAGETALSTPSAVLALLGPARVVQPVGHGRNP